MGGAPVVKMHDARLTEIEQAALDTMRDTMQQVIDVAKTLVPVEEGDLRDSGKVIVDGLQVTGQFSGPHAWLQHERLAYQHPRGGQAKYLEAAAEQVAPAQVIRTGVTARLRR